MYNENTIGEGKERTDGEGKRQVTHQVYSMVDNWGYKS